MFRTYQRPYISSLTGLEVVNGDNYEKYHRLDVTPFSLVGVYRCFRGSRDRLASLVYSSTLKMAVGSSETSIIFYQTIRRKSPCPAI
jgi:hypothetical protein